MYLNEENEYPFTILKKINSRYAFKKSNYRDVKNHTTINSLLILRHTLLLTFRNSLSFRSFLTITILYTYTFTSIEKTNDFLRSFGIE